MEELGAHLASIDAAFHSISRIYRKEMVPPQGNEKNSRSSCRLNGSASERKLSGIMEVREMNALQRSLPLLQ